MIVAVSVDDIILALNNDEILKSMAVGTKLYWGGGGGGDHDKRNLSSCKIYCRCKRGFPKKLGPHAACRPPPPPQFLRH